MEAFVQAYAEHRGAIERYVRFRISNPEDSEDVLQEVLSAAVTGYGTLRDITRFKPWLIGIARNKCADFLRRKYRRNEVALEEAGHIAVIPLRFALTRDSLVLDTLEQLSPQDQQILRLYYWQELPQQEIARRLHVPLGTVKSRLHNARERFRAAFPIKPKGVPFMATIMPQILPDYTITPSPLPPFACKWEELMGWFIVPRLGEKLSWAMYDFPDRIRTEADDLAVVGRAMVHGIEGVEIEVKTHHPMSCNQTGDSADYVQRSFVAQLTDTHCRILSETHTQGGMKQIFTFLDGDAFLENWGFGEDNCGNETNLSPKGLITREENVLTDHSASKEAMDVVGRYTVTIGGKTYDTCCVVMHETYMGGMASEQFIDRNGRTVLWRRFNADNWQHERYGKRWTEMLPDAETVIINGTTYVHWYDCITSYIL
ncbi:MAG: RNA polymerase sigma factor [Aristaeellaceae bacterium]